MTKNGTTTAVRVGIIGAGFMGDVHARAARAAGAEIVGVASRTLASATETADRFGVAAFAGLDELLATKPDVVHVCTPNDTHAAITAQVLAAGIAVVCEKPLAATAADARALVDAAAGVGVVNTVPFIYRYHPMVREARALVQQGAVGPVLSVQASYLQDWMLLQTDTNWRMSDGSSRAFADIGSHLCDLVEFVMGERIVRLSARTRIVYTERAGQPVRNEDIAAVLVEFRSGTIGTLLVSQMAAGRKNALEFELHGAQQSVKFEQEKPEQLHVGTRGATMIRSRDAAQLSGDAARLSIVPSGHPMGYQDAFNGFVRDTYSAWRGEAPDGLPTFVDGLRAAIVSEAVIASASQAGAWTDVESSRGEHHG